VGDNGDLLPLIDLSCSRTLPIKKKIVSDTDYIPATGDVIMFFDDPNCRRIRRKEERRFVYKLLERKSNRPYVSRRTVIVIDNTELGYKIMEQLFRKFGEPRDVFCNNFLIGRMLNREELPEPEREPSRWRVTHKMRKELAEQQPHFRY
jgi:hypothetical protein